MATSDRAAVAAHAAPELLWGGVGTLFLAAGAALFAVAPRLLGRLTGCLFKAGTGIPCPTCGTTRVLEALAAGDPAGALLTNPLAALALAAGTLYLGYAWLAVAGVVRPRRPGWLTHPMPCWLRWGLPLLLLVNWAYLILHGV